MKAIILNMEKNMGRDEITFQYIAADGVVIGPFVERRPKGEDHQAWLDLNVSGMEESYNRVPPTDDETLLNDILSYQSDVVERVLGVTSDQVATYQVERQSFIQPIQETVLPSPKINP